MANRWGDSGNSVRLYFGGNSKITANGDCSHKIKKRLLLGKKVMTNLDSILKSRDIIWPTKVRLVKAMFWFCFCFFLNFKILILTCVPKHEPPSHFPPHNIFLGHPHAPAPSMLYPASDMDWRFNSYMIVYMLECHSPKSSHPLPLPLSPKVHYTHLYLFCCLAYRVVIAIFLNSIYMC